ncbi:MAG: hypothetical protein KGP01_05720 [Actinomycetales bacterium]|nr:hypothetical protein [Actinomycetales bacterium]
MEDIASPVDEYAAYFADAHARNVSEYFEALVQRAGVDERANIATVAQLRDLETGVAKGNSRRKWWRIARFLCVALAGAAAFVAIKLGHGYLFLLVAAVGFAVLIFVKINPEVGALNTQLADLTSQREGKASEAWHQMLPLNSLHVWGTAQRLFEKTLPQFQFDNYFANDRLADLHATFGLSPDLNNWRSVLHCQSGHLNGNPFVLARFLHHTMGSMTYSGQLVIAWTERVQNSQGQWITVQRTQTLTASVTKPFPEYATHAGIIYGCEAAPNLSFSRNPSKLSGRGDGAVSDWKLNRKIKEVERQARKATKSGSGNLTVMSNREFEALFGATNRTDEVEFRMLFTALAQQEMVKLMNDQNAGPGDDFGFSKTGPLNIIDSRQLDAADLVEDPARFQTLELAEARRIFNEFHKQYFWAVYFGFSPLLTIPLYQEDRNLDSQSPYSSNPDACFWEHEALANYIGQSAFAHPDSATQNILRANSQQSGDGASLVTISAHGYRAVPRIDEIPTRGGDGRIHLVPVPWTEYIPVEQHSQMLAGHTASRNSQNHEHSAEVQNSWQSVITRYGHNPERTVLRGVMAASLFRR